MEYFRNFYGIQRRETQLRLDDGMATISFLAGSKWTKSVSQYARICPLHRKSELGSLALRSSSSRGKCSSSICDILSQLLRIQWYPTQHRCIACISCRRRNHSLGSLPHLHHGRRTERQDLEPSSELRLFRQESDQHHLLFPTRMGIRHMKEKRT